MTHQVATTTSKHPPTKPTRKQSVAARPIAPVLVRAVSEALQQASSDPPPTQAWWSTGTFDERFASRWSRQDQPSVQIRVFSEQGLFHPDAKLASRPVVWRTNESSLHEDLMAARALLAEDALVYLVNKAIEEFATNTRHIPDYADYEARWQKQCREHMPDMLRWLIVAAHRDLDTYDALEGIEAPWRKIIPACAMRLHEWLQQPCAPLPTHPLVMTRSDVVSSICRQLARPVSFAHLRVTRKIQFFDCDCVWATLCEHEPVSAGCTRLVEGQCTDYEPEWAATAAWQKRFAPAPAVCH